MIPTFNLIEEPWIPATEADGQVREFGLREVLARAHELRAVAASTPLETASILRLLLAVLHRTHDTSSQAAWAKTWQQACFDTAALNTYWDAWKHRFDLFDSEHPFYQTKEERKKAVSTAAFYPGLAAADHYNHIVQRDEAVLTPAEAARSVLVAQTFGLSGGCLPAKKLSHKNSPCVAGITFLIEGDNLFQTLISNLLRYDEDHPTQELTRTGADRPNWEADDPYEPRDRALGYLDYLTWPARGVKLKPEICEGKTIVRTYVDYVGIAPPEVLDPFKFYRKDEKAKNKTGHIAMYLSQNRATWRNASTILRLHSDRLRPPAALNWLADLRRKGALGSPRAHLAGYALIVENQTKVILMRRETIPLPLAYLDQSVDPQMRSGLLEYLDTALQQAESTGKALSDSIFAIAKELYPRPGAKSEDHLAQDQRHLIDSIAHSISTLDEFWASIERPFYQLVINLAESEDPVPVMNAWLSAIVVAGRAALAESERRAGKYPKALKAGVRGRSKLESGLRKAGLVSIHPSEGA